MRYLLPLSICGLLALPLNAQQGGGGAGAGGQAGGQAGSQVGGQVGGQTAGQTGAQVGVQGQAGAQGQAGQQSGGLGLDQPDTSRPQTGAGQVQDQFSDQTDGLGQQSERTGAFGDQTLQDDARDLGTRRGTTGTEQQFDAQREQQRSAIRAQDDGRQGGGRQADNRWRYKRHNGEWWYWTNDNRWLFWRDSRWNEYDPGTFQMPGNRAIDRNYVGDGGGVTYSDGGPAYSGGGAVYSGGGAVYGDGMSYRGGGGRYYSTPRQRYWTGYRGGYYGQPYNGGYYGRGGYGYGPGYGGGGWGRG